MLATIEQIQIYLEEYIWETAADPKTYPLLFDLTIFILTAHSDDILIDGLDYYNRE